MEVKAVFSVEISNEIPDTVKDWEKYRPFKFLCGSIAYSSSTHQGVNFFIYDDPTMLLQRINTGIAGGRLYSWNGLGFGFVALADSTGCIEDCARFANLHTDVMFDFFCRHGYPISLLSVAHGFGFDDEVERIMTNNSKVCGWAKEGRTEEIALHSRMKTVLILRVVEKIEESHGIVWINSRGQLSMETIEYLHPVCEAFHLQEPDMSYMSDPKTRESFISWQRGGKQ